MELGALGLLGSVALKGCKNLPSQQSQELENTEQTIYQSENAVLEVTLTAQYQNLILAKQTFPKMMTYNGQLPAPRLEVNRGDRLIIHLQNELDQATNLHFHGLHLSPNNNQDNFF